MNQAWKECYPPRAENQRGRGRWPFPLLPRWRRKPMSGASPEEPEHPAPVHPWPARAASHIASHMPRQPSARPGRHPTDPHSGESKPPGRAKQGKHQCTPECHSPRPQAGQGIHPRQNWPWRDRSQPYAHDRRACRPAGFSARGGNPPRSLLVPGSALAFFDLAGHFSPIVGGGQVERRKLSPDGYRKVIRDATIHAMSRIGKRSALG
jgi:hypothetical protein